MKLALMQGWFWILLVLFVGYSPAKLAQADVPLPLLDKPINPVSHAWRVECGSTENCFSFFDWDPEDDYHALFNVAYVPLQPRFVTERKGKTDTIYFMNLGPGPGGSSDQGSQGAPLFDTYNFTYWQYVDIFVYFGGQIIAPPPTWINAAHRNGVKFYGNVYFDNHWHPGEDGEASNFVYKDTRINDDGKEEAYFPAADILVAMAKYYGFDGWFINQEADVFKETATLYQEFLDYFQTISDGIEIAWYDAMNTSGHGYGQQGKLNNNNVMFFQTVGSDGKPIAGEQNKRTHKFYSDHGWSTSILGPQVSRSTAQSINRDPLNVHTGVYYHSTYFDAYKKYDMIKPDGQEAITSIGVLGADWARFGKGGEDDPEFGYDEFKQRDNRLWVGPTGDPLNQNSTGERGVAHYVFERSVITQFPFVTHFNQGNGQRYFTDGEEVLGYGEWNHFSQQDILPTWQFTQDPSMKDNNFSIGFTYDRAYQGGASLLASYGGEKGQQAQAMYRLYATRIPLDGQSFTFQVTYQFPNGKMKNNQFAAYFITECDDDDQQGRCLHLLAEDSVALTPRTERKLGRYFAKHDHLTTHKKAMANGWETLTAGINLPADETNIIELGVIVDENTVAIGEMRLVDYDQIPPHANQVSEGESQWTGDTVTVNIAWEHDNSDIAHFAIWGNPKSSSPKYLGRAYANLFHIASFDNSSSKSTFAEFGVQPVGTNGRKAALDEIATVIVEK